MGIIGVHHIQITIPVGAEYHARTFYGGFLRLPAPTDRIALGLRGQQTNRSVACRVESILDVRRHYDSLVLELTLRAPTNVTGFTFDLNFFTYNFPNFICSEYSDAVVVLMDPAPGGAVDGNLLFDSNAELLTSSPMLQMCVAQTAGGRVFDCSLGSGGLVGTGLMPPQEPTGSARRPR